MRSGHIDPAPSSPTPEPLKMSPTAQNNGFRSKVPILMFLRIEFSTRLKKSLLELNNFKIFEKIRDRLLKNGRGEPNFELFSKKIFFLLKVTLVTYFRSGYFLIF